MKGKKHKGVGAVLYPATFRVGGAMLGGGAGLVLTASPIGAFAGGAAGYYLGSKFFRKKK